MSTLAIEMEESANSRSPLSIRIPKEGESSDMLSETKADADKSADTNTIDTRTVSSVDVPSNKFQYYRYYVYETFENPEFTVFAKIINAYLTFLIFFSTLTLCLQSIYSLTNTPEKESIWNVIETIIVTSFTVDFVLRLLTCPSYKDFFLTFLNWVDILAILPFYIEIGLKGTNISGLGAVRVLRLIRIFRILKIGKSSDSIRLMTISLQRSANSIGVLVFMVCSAVVFFSSFVYFSEISICDIDPEQGLWIYTSGPLVGKPTQFQSIIATFWWAIVTMTTVGYGDFVPVTTYGKIVCSVTILCGIMVLAFPINVIGVHFTETYKEFEDEKKRKEFERRMKRMKKTNTNNNNNSANPSSPISPSRSHHDNLANSEKRIQFEMKLAEIVHKMEELNKEIQDLSMTYYDH